jgi:hypothetical protein
VLWQRRCGRCGRAAFRQGAASGAQLPSAMALSCTHRSASSRVGRAPPVVASVLAYSTDTLTRSLHCRLVPSTLGGSDRGGRSLQGAMPVSGMPCGPGRARDLHPLGFRPCISWGGVGGGLVCGTSAFPPFIPSRGCTSRAASEGGRRRLCARPCWGIKAPSRRIPPQAAVCLSFHFLLTKGEQRPSRFTAIQAQQHAAQMKFGYQSIHCDTRRPLEIL